MKITTLLGAAFLGLSASVASAATFTINHGTFGAIPDDLTASEGENDFLDAHALFFGLSNPQSGYFGSWLSSDAGENFVYVYEVFGSEAGFNNTFSVDGNSYSTGGSTSGAGNFSQTALATFVSSSLDFSFSTAGPISGNPLATNSATGNPDNTEDNNPDVNFFVTFGGENGEATEGFDVVWLFMDDGGANENDNHDDLVVRITIAPVPLPAAGFLLLGGLGGLAALKRRKKA